MKHFVPVALIAIYCNTAIAQTQPTVTIDASGNRNKQVVVDGKYYTLNNAATNDQQQIVINDLSTGQHTLQLVRLNTNNRSATTKTTFNVRSGYDLAIKISANGSISSSETRIARNTGGNHNNNNENPISTNAYNSMYARIKAKTTSTTRAALLETELNDLSRTLTAKQASTLIALVNSESLRLKLAKQSYSHISDTENFSLVSNLLASTTNRNELQSYIATIDNDDDDDGDVAVIDEPLTDQRFREVLDEVNREPVGERVYYLSNFFSRDYNYYTSAQAKQFIDVVSGEQDRLTLAKNAYRGVTDRENYGVVYQLLSSPSSRTQLVSYINSYDKSNPLTAMSSVAFDKIYQSAYSQYSSTSRYNTINTAFTTAGNYFTVAQAKKLIPLVSSESNRIQLAKTVYPRLIDKSNYTQFNEFLSTTANRNDFATFVKNFDNSYGSGPIAMNETDFNTLYNKVNNTWSSSSRFSILADAFRNQSAYFSTQQARRLISMVNMESDRLTLAKNVYDNIVDPSNFSELYDLFSSTINKNDLAAYVSTYQSGNGTIVKVPMSESEFNSTYRNIQLTFGIGAKYSSLATLFNTETNFFTTSQVKQLIQLVSSESNRLELAKASYDNITDPANFTQIYDIFSSQSSKNELMNYVSSNAYNNQ